MLPSHHLNNHMRPLNPAHTRSGARDASTPVSQVCPAQVSHARERNPVVPLPNVRTTSRKASLPISRPRNNIVVRPKPYISYQQDDKTRDARHFTYPTNEHATLVHHGIIADINRQEDVAHIAETASDAFGAVPGTARLPFVGNRHSNYADANPRSLARLEYSLNAAIGKFEGRNGRPWRHPQQDCSNTDLLETTDTPPVAPSQPRQIGSQVSILRANIWLCIVLLSLFSTVLAICLFIKAKTKPWSTSAQTCVLVWMTVSIGILFMSLFTFCRHGKIGGRGCLGIEIGRGWRLLSIRPTRTRSDEQTAREEEIELSSLDGNNPHHTYDLSGRDGGGRRRDKHNGSAGPALQSMRFSLEARNISGTSEPQASNVPSSRSDSGSSMHPGFGKKDPLRLPPDVSFPKAADINTLSGTPRFEHNLNGLKQPWRSRNAKVDHKRARHPPLLGQSDPDLIVQKQLLQSPKEQDEVREKYRQDHQQARRKVCSDSKQRPDTPRVKLSTVISKTCSDIPPIEEIQTPIVVQKTRELRPRITNLPSPGLGTSPTPVSPLIPSVPRIQRDDRIEVDIPAADHAVLPITAIEDPQHERPAYVQRPVGSRQQEVYDTRSSERKSKMHSHRPYESSDLSDFSSPPSSYGGSVIRYLPTKISTAGSEGAEGFPFSSKQEHNDVTDYDVSTHGTPPALSESVVELDRHLRNSGAVELNTFLSGKSEDRYPETRASSLDEGLERRCRGRTRERAWFHTHLSQCRNLSAIEDTELDLDAEVRAAQDNAAYIPYSFRAASAQSLTPCVTPGREVSIEAPSSPAPGRSSCSSSQSLGGDFEPSPPPLTGQNNEISSHETLETTEEPRNSTNQIFSKSGPVRQNAIAYSPRSVPVHSPVSSPVPRHPNSRPLDPRSMNTIFTSAKDQDGNTYSKSAAAAQGGMGGSGRGARGFVASSKGKAESVKDGKRNGNILLEEQRDGYEDKENMDPSDIGITW